jgi:hypothetical protein
MAAGCFTVPTRRLAVPQHLVVFQHSPAYSKLTAFITTIAKAVEGVSLRDECHVSEVA